MASVARGLLKRLKATRWGYPVTFARERTTAVPGERWATFSSPVRMRASFGHLNANRLHNMREAAARISGVRLRPGRVFSFWHVVGPPTTANGFLDGPTLIGGRLATDTGGGLCQVSSTLFNAFLLANLELLEKHNHSVDAHGADRFLPLGRDAAVAWGHKDLVVRNDTSTTLVVGMELDEATPELSAWIASDTRTHREVEITTSVLSEIPPAGDPRISNPGWRVRTVRRSRHVGGDPFWEINYETIETYAPCDRGSPDPG